MNFKVFAKSIFMFCKFILYEDNKRISKDIKEDPFYLIKTTPSSGIKDEICIYRREFGKCSQHYRKIFKVVSKHNLHLIPMKANDNHITIVSLRPYELTLFAPDGTETEILMNHKCGKEHCEEFTEIV